MRDWRSYTQKSLSKLGVYSSKSKGQNFLCKYDIVKRMVNEAHIDPNDHILEIGGGLGILTDALVQTGAKITVIEKDRRLAKHLRDIYSSIELIEADALTAKWPQNVRVIANLPYSISTPLLAKIIHHSTKDAMIMLQREVALRCTANPGSKDYSRLSILCNLHCHVKKIMNVPPESFFPVPKVNSQIIHLIPKTSPISIDHISIELLTRNLFSLRRRTLRKVIRGFLKRKGLSEDLWNEIPHKEKRVKDLTLSNIEEIFLFLQENNAWPLA